MSSLKTQLHFPWLRNFVLVLLVLGTFFRFYNLDRQVYWYDETLTSLRATGYIEAELVDAAFDGRVMSVGDFLEQYQYPNDTRNLQDTLNALAAHPEHSPLYYLLARFWLQSFPHAVASIRLLSAIIGLLVFPCVYWLCWEIFGNRAVAWMSLAVMAISPFHILYAREAREYSLWAVTILLASAAFLRAMRCKTWTAWAGYGGAIALSLYTHPFSGLVIVGHGIYLAIISRMRWRSSWTQFLAASGLGLVLFSPWLWIVVNRFSLFVSNTDSVNHNRSGFLPLFWGLNLSRIFFDVNQGSSPWSPLHYLGAALLFYSLYFLYRQGKIESWIFIMTLIGVTGTALIAPDLLIGGRRSSITRYAIPCYLGIQLAVAYMLGVGIARGVSQRWKQGAILLAVCGIVSASVSSHIPVWWHKSYAKSRLNPSVARIVNMEERPLLISDEIPGRILSLSHLLNPDVHLQLSIPPEIPEIAPGFDPVFFYRPSDSMKAKLASERNINLEPTEVSWLWRREQ